VNFGKKTLLKTLLKTLEEVRKIALENLSENRLREPIFIGFPKYSRWGS